jgi:hypothetical protein
MLRISIILLCASLSACCLFSDDCGEHPYAETSMRDMADISINGVE